MSLTRRTAGMTHRRVRPLIFSRGRPAESSENYCVIPMGSTCGAYRILGAILAALEGGGVLVSMAWSIFGLGDRCGRRLLPATWRRLRLPPRALRWRGSWQCVGAGRRGRLSLTGISRRRGFSCRSVPWAGSCHRPGIRSPGTTGAWMGGYVCTRTLRTTGGRRLPYLERPSIALRWRARFLSGRSTRWRTRS